MNRALRILFSGVTLVLAALAAGSALAEGNVYTCVDARGSTLTSDRPIAACLDRVQRRLDATGVTLEIIEPPQTAAERAAADTRARQQRMEQRRARELERRDQALLVRYPNRSAHEAARADALQRIRRVIDGAADHLVALRQEQDTLQTELEFYQNDLQRAPAALRSNMQANRDAQDRTLQFIADQQAERNRINDQFDREGRHLAQLWRNAEASDD